MQSKKIFFVADARSIHTVRWVDYFVEKNYDVYLATFAQINNTQCKKVYFLSDRINQVNGGNYYYLYRILKLSRIFKEVNPDIINAHYSYSMGLVSLFAKKLSGIQSEFSVVCHGSDILSPPKTFIFDWLNKYILNRCNKVFVVSDQIKDKVESFGIDMNKVFVGQYGIHIENKDTIKHIDILSNRTYNNNSRIDFLLESMECLKELNLKIVFVLPTISNDDFKNLSEKYHHIKFYQQIDYSKSIELVSLAKIYVSATKSDGTSLSLMEAMELNCIPIVSNIVSNRSWVLDGVNGFLFDTKSQFLEKVQYALDCTDNKLMEINKINKDIIKQRCNYNIQMKKIENFLLR